MLMTSTLSHPNIVSTGNDGIDYAADLSVFLQVTTDTTSEVHGNNELSAVE